MQSPQRECNACYPSDAMLPMVIAEDLGEGWEMQEATIHYICHALW